MTMTDQLSEHDDPVVGIILGQKRRHCTSGHCASGQLSLTWLLSLDGWVPTPQARYIQAPHGLSLSDWGRTFLTVNSLTSLAKRC